ncbi:MAG: HAD-IB family hydrolase [Actinomycetota bacterium]
MTSPSNTSPSTASPRAAAIFDLDRTLLLGASGPVISAALRRQGVLSDRFTLGERLAFGLFDLVGETLPSILLSREGVRATRGWSVAAVRRAAEEVAPELEARVEPFAVETIAEHRAAGRKLVLATTTPHDLIAPFAERLGFDGVLATRHRITVGDAGPVYAGSVDGEFVWSQGKARSVAVWARANGIELADSYAYSDSIFDVPMLSKVGHPVAVNPDPRLLAYATMRGWPRVWFNAPPGVAKPLGVELQDLVANLARPELFPWLEIDLRHLDRLPSDGGVLLAANHRSYLDPMMVAFAAARAGRPARFLAKQEVTDAPVSGAVVRALGAIRVDRGSGSDTPLVEAGRALRAGELVAVFPQGTIPRGRAFFDPELRGRHGAVRLAIEAGAPIVPIGLWGTERAWPRNARLPYLLNLADPPTIMIRVGEPYHPTTDDVPAATAELMARIGELLPPDARRPAEPTEAQLAGTHPSGG